MSIRSMHKWYSAASIVSVPINEDVNVWMTHGWCLQESQAARAILLDISQFPRGGQAMLKRLLDMGYVSTDVPASLWLCLMQKREQRGRKTKHMRWSAC